jgi:hypothetical protein
LRDKERIDLDIAKRRRTNVAGTREGTNTVEAPCAKAHHGAAMGVAAAEGELVALDGLSTVGAVWCVSTLLRFGASRDCRKAMTAEPMCKRRLIQANTVDTAMEYANHQPPLLIYTLATMAVISQSKERPQKVKNSMMYGRTWGMQKARQCRTTTAIRPSQAITARAITAEEGAGRQTMEKE